MTTSIEQYGNEELLRSVHNALKQWKWLESSYGNRDLDEDEICAIESLKENYLSLLMEVRRRKLSLTPEQLINIILFPCPSNEI